MKTRNLLWLSATLLMTACTNEEEISINSSMPIQFNANISKSRVSGDSWESGDKIGVFMSGNGVTPANNVPYVTQATNGTFQAEGIALSFPEPANDVTFYAYYPYSTEVTGNTLTFNVDGKTDVLWANETVQASEQQSNTVELSFNHALSKVTVNPTGFPEDIEMTLSETYSQATLDITTGKVTGNGTTGTVSIPFVKTNETYSAIVLPASNASKTLTITSISASKKWEYTFTVNYQAGYQYAYNASLLAENTSIKLESNKIAVWQGGTTPENLNSATESEIEFTIAQMLNGKTYTFDTDYFYDVVNNEGRYGWTKGDGSAFGDNYKDSWKWNEDLHKQCQNSSIEFYLEAGQLKANAVNNGTEINGITVTIDENTKQLTFSQAPFSFHSHFTNNWVGGYDKNGTNPEPGKEGKSWLLFAQDLNYDYGTFIVNTNVEKTSDLFADGKMHWSYQAVADNDSEDKTGNQYYVINFVEVKE